MDSNRYAHVIRERRRELGLRQYELADFAGVSERLVRDLEHGKPGARLDKVEQVLEALGLELTVTLRRR